ncbi:MAG: COG4315 family predicted lipoprotein [Actinomycetes bacterium]
MLILLLVSAAALAGCGGEGAPAMKDAAGAATSSPAASSPVDSPTSPPTEAAATGTLVKTADSDFGTMLFDETGQAIYLFDKEKTDRAECYDACADAWPPVLTDGDPRGAGDVRSSLLGTTRRTDGSTQVTYGGHPLYFYAHEGRNQVLCHNVSEFGGLWLVVTPSGEPAA